MVDSSDCSSVSRRTRAASPRRLAGRCQRPAATSGCPNSAIFSISTRTSGSKSVLLQLGLDGDGWQGMHVGVWLDMSAVWVSQQCVPHTVVGTTPSLDPGTQCLTKRRHTPSNLKRPPDECRQGATAIDRLSRPLPLLPPAPAPAPFPESGF